MDTQFKKGVLDLCVLSLINQNEMYGYGLKVEMSKMVAYERYELMSNHMGEVIF